MCCGSQAGGVPRPQPRRVAPEPPLYEAQGLLGVVPTQNSTLYDVREVGAEPAQRGEERRGHPLAG